MNSKIITIFLAVLFISASAQYYSPYGYYGGYYSGLAGYTGYAGYAAAYPGYGYGAYAYPGYGYFGYGSNKENDAAAIKANSNQAGSNIKLTNNN
uniref:Uncharacterized protein n=1 Tax=Parastrongyloides trichosuri TaxID=131310 RepID=A0A0N4ZZW8_PARTI